MTDRIWNETEDQVILQIQQLLYYGDGDIFTQVQTLLGSVGDEIRQELFESALSQVRYEQAERRRFICEQYLFNSEQLNRTQQEGFIRSLYGTGIDQPIPTTESNIVAPGGQLKQSTITKNVFEQLSLYQRVEDNIANYYQRKNSLELVAPYYNSLKQATKEQRLALYGGIEQFFSGLAAYGNDPPFNHITIPNSLVAMLESLGLAGSLERFEMFGEQLNFLVRLKRIIEALDAVENKQVSEETAITATGLYLQQYGS